MSGKVRTKVNNKNQAKPNSIKEAITYKNRFGLNPYLLPLMFVLCILPLIIHVKVYQDQLDDYPFFYSENGISSDVFLYYKMVFFITVSCIMLILVGVRTFLSNQKISFVKLFVPLGGYALLAFLSAVFSKTSHFSFMGIYEHFESVWVLLGYAITAYYAFLIVSTAKDLDWLMRALTAGTLIMLLLGLSQAFSHDFIRSDFARNLLIPSEILEANPDAKLEFQFSLDRVYLTLYNPNYVGSYASLLSPVFLMYGLAKKNIKLLIINLVIYIGLLLCLLGSGSKAGFIGIFFSLLLLAVIYNKILLKFIPEFIIGIVLVVGTIYTYNNYTNGQLVNRMKNALEIQPSESTLKGIDATDEYISLHYKDTDLIIAFISDSEITTMDGSGSPVEYIGTFNSDSFEYNYVTKDSRFSTISVSYLPNRKIIVKGREMSPVRACIIKVDGKEYKFVYIDQALGKTFGYDYGYYCLTKADKLSKFNSAEHLEALSKYGRAFSGRFFIWSYTLPLLKDNIILGTGPDTFMLNFPNDDYVAMENNGYGDQVMTKPHNMYLQIAVQTGVLSLVCFLVFYIWYFVSSIRLFRRADRSEFTVMLGIGILCGTFGYMIVGLINDSMIVTAPLFWCFTGIGIAINFMIRRDQPSVLINEIKKDTDTKAKNKKNDAPVTADTSNSKAEAKTEDNIEGNTESTSESNSENNSGSNSENNTEYKKENSSKNHKNHKSKHKK